MKKHLTVVTQRNDYGTKQVLYIDNDEQLGVYDLSECPEDAIIGRDLVDCGDIAKYIKMGAMFAREGFELVINSEKVDYLEEFDIEEYLKKVEVQA